MAYTRYSYAVARKNDTNQLANAVNGSIVSITQTFHALVTKQTNTTYTLQTNRLEKLHNYAVLLHITDDQSRNIKSNVFHQ